MAGKADIEAGKAHVKIYVDSSQLVKGLQSAGRRVQSFGTSVAKIGSAVAAAGTAALGALGAMAKGFADAGSAIADMSARTGLAAEELSGLAYAANMTGASIDDVERAVRFMQKNGLSAADLPKFADELAAIQDPAERTRYAIEKFGKAGVALIPMLSDGSSGLNKFRAEAQRLGLVMSTEDAAAADELGDAIDRVTGSVKGIVMQIGAALAPLLTDLAGRITAVVGRVVEFVRNNRSLVVTIAAVAAGVTVVGTAVAALGGVIAAAGFAMTGLASAVGVVGAIVGAIVSPIGLLVAAASALGAGFVYVSGAGSYLSFQLGTIWTAIKGIAGALLQGDWARAWEIAKASMYALGSALLDMFGQLPQFIGYAAGRTARAIVDAMSAAMGWIRQAWEYMFTAILQTAIQIGPEILKALVTGGIGSAASVVGQAAGAAFGKAQQGMQSIGAGWNKQGAPTFNPSQRTLDAIRDLKTLSGAQPGGAVPGGVRGAGGAQSEQLLRVNEQQLRQQQQMLELSRQQAAAAQSLNQLLALQP